MTDTGAIRVLHVDDDPDFLEVVATYLHNEDESLSITTAADAETGLERLAQQRFDCVVSDYKMPEMDGLSLLSAVREQHPEMPFILYTGHGSEEIASEAISAGVTDYMQKETGTDQYTVLANTIRNAVEHQRAEAALEESEERYRTLVEQSHDGIYIYQDEQFVFFNDRVCEITGYDRDQLSGRPIWDLIHPDDQQRVKEIGARRAAGEDAPSRYQARVVTAAGETRHLEFSVRAITYDGAYAGMGSVRDVTDRYRQEQRLEEFASIVAHDLRNPLNVIAGRIELAEESGDEMHFDAMERNVEKLEELIVDMRELASEGVPVHEAGVVDVGKTAQDAWADLGGDGDLTVAEDLPTIEADGDRLETLFVEVLENATIHAHSEDEPPSIRVESRDGGFAIVDDGPGIRESERERVTEPGYTTVTERTGFGLAMVEWIAEAHGWTLTVTESEAGGTTILIDDVLAV